VTLNTNEVLAEIDSVFERCGASKDRPTPPKRANPPGYFGSPNVIGSASAMVSSCLAAIERNAPQPSYVRIAREMAREGRTSSATVEKLLGVLLSVRQDIEAGFTKSLEVRARESVFDDFLDMAEHIRSTVHFAPAVVLAGSVLEEHARKLAEKNEIALVDERGKARAFEQLCHELVREEVFTEPQRKVLAGWYAQRTEAAHGRFENVIADDVPRIIEGVRDFITRDPA
jgi:hypothetical protein